MQNNYTFITNFIIDRLPNIKTALLAAGITGYKFCKTAMDTNGHIMPDCYALYFEKAVTPKEIELFYYAIGVVEEKIREGEREYD